MSSILVACASQPPEPIAAVVPTENLTSIAQIRTVTAAEADNGRVCEYRKRPGSHIAEKYCYTLQERLANQEANDELVRQQLEDLQRDQRMREEMERQMEMERRRREAAAFGVRQP